MRIICDIYGKWNISDSFLCGLVWDFSEENKVKICHNKKDLLRERKRHTAHKRVQDADPPPAGPDPPPGWTWPPPGWTWPPPQVWTDKQSETITFPSYYVRGR